MNIHRHRSVPQPTPPASPPIADNAFEAIVREEFLAADKASAPVLNAMQRDRVPLSSVSVDTDRGSATLHFADRTTIIVATDSEEVAQLHAAAKLTDTYLVHTITRTDTVGRLLVFTAAHWTIYLPITLARV